MAEPGEFTKTCILNGRIDLSQAEAVIDIITNSTNELVHSEMHFHSFEGSLSKEIENVRNELVHLCRTNASHDRLSG